jgi:hypothetical protein
MGDNLALIFVSEKQKYFSGRGWTKGGKSVHAPAVDA